MSGQSAWSFQVGTLDGQIPAHVPWFRVCGLFVAPGPLDPPLKTEGQDPSLWFQTGWTQTPWLHPWSTCLVSVGVPGHICRVIQSRSLVCSRKPCQGPVFPRRIKARRPRCLTVETRDARLNESGGRTRTTCLSRQRGCFLYFVPRLLVPLELCA